MIPLPLAGRRRLRDVTPGKQGSLVLLGATATGTALVMAPVARGAIVALCLVAVAWITLLPRGWFSGADRATRRVIRLFLVLRLVMPLVFQLTGNFAGLLFTGGSDSLRYHQYGSRVAADLLATGASRSHTRVPGTGTVELAVGYLYSLGAPVRVIGNYAFAAMATIGMLLFWWATKHLAGDRRTRYTGFVLMAPTLLFWNAGISKEAVMTFATGCIVAGVYFLSQRSLTGRGLAYLVLGVATAGFVRPHIPLLLMASAVVGAALGASGADYRAGARRLVPLAVAAACLLFLLPLTRALIDPAGEQSLAEAAYAQAENTAAVGGRSSFDTSPTRSVVDMPNAVVTVLFRPFPWEARTVPQLLASAEAVVIGTVLVVTAWALVKRRGRIVRSPLVVMSGTFTVLFCSAFASLGNFGLLVRERMQVLAFLILLIFSVRPVPAPGRHVFLRPRRRPRTVPI